MKVMLLILGAMLLLGGVSYAATTIYNATIYNATIYGGAAVAEPSGSILLESASDIMLLESASDEALLEG